MDVEWCCVMWNMLCLEMWLRETVVGGRLQCSVVSDVEYGPR